MRGLVGRDEERERLLAALGRNRLVLVSGEAGVGKTRLAAEAAADGDVLVLAGAARQSTTPPYGPVVEALRSYLRVEPDGLAACGPLQAHLALLLPELGDSAPASDRATLVEAVRCALDRVAAGRRVLVVLDDLQWSDQATLDLLGALAGVLPVPVVAVYRSDGLPREHGVRRLRQELRRGGLLEEIALAPLGREATGELLGGVLGRAPSPGLVAAVHDRTQGLPFFVEEVAAALGPDDQLPLPDTVRDAVLLTTAELSAQARVAAEAAAVAGAAFDLDLVASLSSHAGLAELVERDVVREDGAGGGAFRHALTRDALYGDVPWLRRRSLHHRIAEALEAGGAPAAAVAVHWTGAREPERARAALLRAAAESEAVHAHRDAAEACRAALDGWPERPDDADRNATLERYARCTELSGDFGEAARAWRELAAMRAGDTRALADAQRRLAAVQDLRGDRDAAAAARTIAADSFAAAGCPADAAVERLALANQLRLAARHRDAVGLARQARAEADDAQRLDLRARALGLEGMATAKLGDHAAGVEMVRSALALALEHDLTAVAAELYQRLSVALYDASDYRQAHHALDTALGLCRATGEATAEVACVSCLAYVLRERGEWEEAAKICHDLIASGSAVFVAEGLLGAMHAAQGRLTSARRLLTSSLAVSTRIHHYNMRVDALGALARVALATGDAAEARERCRALRSAWESSDDHHYAISGLRWAASVHARHGDLRDAQACVEALSRIASESGYADAVAALGSAIAETALAGGDAATAADQLNRAVEQHRAVDLPFQHAELLLRAGVALHAAGEREPALDRLSEAYRIARRLGARPLAAEAAREVAELGESVAARLGRRAAADAEGAGLSRRELEVVRLVAVGRTNPEIAQELVLSRRTVDMHVRNILRKLDCRSRVEAAGRASELGLLA